jgi:hypothetical protein
VKRINLIKKLKCSGCILIRHGGNHDWHQNPNTKINQPIPRYGKIVESLAKHIIKKLSGFHDVVETNPAAFAAYLTEKNGALSKPSLFGQGPINPRQLIGQILNIGDHRMMNIPI